MIIGKDTGYAFAAATALYYGRKIFSSSDAEEHPDESNKQEKEEHHDDNQENKQDNQDDGQNNSRFVNERNEMEIVKNNMVNIDFIKNLLGESINNKNMMGLENGINLLNNFIEGYSMLSEKFKDRNILNIDNNLSKLIICKAKSHLELGYLYDDIGNIDNANKNYLIAIKYADKDTRTGEIIMKRALTKLVNNEYMF